MVKKHGFSKKIMRFSDAHRGWPIVTCVLIIICVAVFTAEVLFPDAGWREYAFIPANALSRPWTFATSIFLHASLDHLMFNMIALAFFGYYVETVVGRRSLLATFLLTGVLSGFGSILTTPSSAASWGASGAILGVLGFFAAVHPDYPVRYFFFPGYRPAIVAAITWGVLDFVFLLASTGPIGYGAHLAGLIAGGLLGACGRISKKRRE
jgi:membrane associated rhomboid family serine protease